MMIIIIIIIITIYYDDDDDDENDPNETCKFRDEISSQNWQVFPT